MEEEIIFTNDGVLTPKGKVIEIEDILSGYIKHYGLVVDNEPLTPDALWSYLIFINPAEETLWNSAGLKTEYNEKYQDIISLTAKDLAASFQEDWIERRAATQSFFLGAGLED